jgi:hypothetical protein
VQRDDATGPYLAEVGERLDKLVVADGLDVATGRRCHFWKRMTAVTARLLCKPLRNNSQWQSMTVSKDGVAAGYAGLEHCLKPGKEAGFTLYMVTIIEIYSVKPTWSESA